MATAQDVINEWAADAEQKQNLVKTRSGLLLRWLNQGQLRFANQSEILRAEWKPSVGSTGIITLPTDFLYEFPDRVKRETTATSDYYLRKVDFPIANARSWSGLTAYSIWNGSLYIWAPSSCNPNLPYVRKPTVLTTMASDLEIPTEFHETLLEYMDIRWDRDQVGKTKYPEFKAELEAWDQQARADGNRWKVRDDKSPVMRSNFF